MKTKEIELDGHVFTVYIGDDRKYRIRIECLRCGKEAFPLLSRIQKGQGKFCSVECANLFEQENAKYGKEYAYFFWDEKRQIWIAVWRTSSEKQNSTTKARWVWEMKYGEIPANQIVTYIDGNPKNCELENLKIISRSESNAIHLIGHKVTDSARYAMSRKAKERGEIIRGENHPNWRGGAKKIDYPLEFSRSLCNEIRRRDENRCRVCHRECFGEDGQVHHIDANKNNNDKENLITLCTKCHSLIHAKRKVNDPVILAFRSMLQYG